MGNRISALFASSRPLQATFSVAQPLFAALLATGGIPRLELLVPLAIGSIAGMFSVFALNDLLDYDLDRKMAKVKKEGWDIDSVMERHPLAGGLVTKAEQAAWIAIAGLIAGAIVFLLNPLALALMILAILLEALYCRLATVSEAKVIVAGLLVSAGALIGWFAAGGGYDLALLAPLSLLFFAWEIGGRNIPNDFSDIEQDRELGIKTVPSVHGAATSSKLIAFFAMITVVANIALGVSASLGFVYFLLSTIVGIVFLVVPGFAIARNPTPEESLSYFNKASMFPVVLLAVLVASYFITPLLG